jgi:uncharacterized protein (TIGR04255 family)
MSEILSQLKSTPIIEAVLDIDCDLIDCDLPPGQNLANLENPAKDLMGEKYANVRSVTRLQHHLVELQDAPKITSERSLQAIQFRTIDEKQIVQLRVEGFSFNRLAPYTSLDDYLPEIERTWKIFLEVAKPVQIRVIRLRYINQIPVPAPNGKFDLDKFLKIGPRLPDEDALEFVGFLNQHAAVETKTGNQVQTVLTTLPMQNGVIPLLLDITAFCVANLQPDDWGGIAAKISSLRSLKNLVFENTLTEECIKPYLK